MAYAQRLPAGLGLAAIMATFVALGPAAAQCEQGDAQNQIVCPDTGVTPPPGPSTPPPTTPSSTIPSSTGTVSSSTPPSSSVPSTTTTTVAPSSTTEPPTIAADDVIRGRVGVRLDAASVLDNDRPSIVSERVETIWGSAPSGVTLWSSGSVTGTPGEAGTFEMTYRLHSTSGSTDTALVTFIIADIPPPPPPPPGPDICVADDGDGIYGYAGVEVWHRTDDFADSYDFIAADGSVRWNTSVMNEARDERGVTDTGYHKREWEKRRNTGFDPKEIVYVAGVSSDGTSSTPVRCRRIDVSPIALDLDRSGAVERIETTVVLDITADGSADVLGEWFAPTEGILLDTADGLSTDGAVTGRALIGDGGGRYADGFQKLALHDLDGDVMVSSHEFADLRVWVDADSDARVDPGELSTLTTHGVTALAVAHRSMVSTARLVDGSVMMTEDLWFPVLAG
ncbi:MAG: hypothetical protein AAGD35_02740 [Actinomycetota bacterium]